ncbi:MAG: hypothetical protein LN412_01180 [Candidatus Thermoplasmatota archaeon]|nr:hypothetical protein [Candidatus Thermoplasmatota archaeon]
MTEVLDLTELLGRIELDTFEEKLQELDLSPYMGKKVQMRGCAPVWAHLAVAAKLIGNVEELEFLVDDGREGKPLKVYRRE